MQGSGGCDLASAGVRSMSFLAYMGQEYIINKVKGSEVYSIYSVEVRRIFMYL